MSKPRLEYSKKIVLFTGVIFISQLVLSCLFSWFERDTSIFSYTIPTSGGIFGSAIGFYLNKAKIENVCKGKIRFFEFKMDYMSKHPELRGQIEEDLSVIDSALDSKINTEIEESISESANI